MRTKETNGHETGAPAVAADDPLDALLAEAIAATDDADVREWLLALKDSGESDAETKGRSCRLTPPERGWPAPPKK
jgi:hypothetical protein